MTDKDDSCGETEFLSPGGIDWMKRESQLD